MSEEKRRQIIASFQDKEYRDGYVAAFVRRRLAGQIRETRRARGWTQAELTERAGLPPRRVSAIEDGGAAPTLRTLLRVAAALDVALIVRLAPYSALVDEVIEFDLVVPAFADDAGVA